MRTHEDLRRYVLVETLIGILVAIAFSDAFGWLIFGGRTGVNLRTPDFVLDTLIQSFFVAFMTVLPITLLGRRRVRTGAMRVQLPWGRWPRNVLLRALLIAAPVAVGAGLLHRMCAPVLPSNPLSLAPLLAFKAALGALIAMLVAPVAARAALADAAPRAHRYPLFK